ncbi:hypothetical protein [Fructobacillus americanaquae]|uniref:Helix-turn-helix domain-containing protein n=1 Tax=Fructobacillus americanaquae TaxID=2940302 RepID=A0ABY5C2M0_9LACO|nr:hypothetical protein [Fructobacillus americanaquae]USS91561.1 hypothetical protein M3M36_04310 [Fructobacillus americanaquae]
MEQTSQTVTEWPRWLNLKNSSKYAGCSPNTFKRHLVKAGRVKAHVTGYGVLYDRDEIIKVIKGWH